MLAQVPPTDVLHRLFPANSSFMIRNKILVGFDEVVETHTNFEILQWVEPREGGWLMENSFRIRFVSISLSLIDER